MKAELTSYGDDHLFGGALCFLKVNFFVKIRRNFDQFTDFTLNIACKVRLWRSVKTNLGFFGV